MTKWRDTFKGYERARVNGKLKQDNRRLASERNKWDEWASALALARTEEWSAFRNKWDEWDEWPEWDKRWERE